MRKNIVLLGLIATFCLVILGCGESVQLEEFPQNQGYSLTDDEAVATAKKLNLDCNFLSSDNIFNMCYSNTKVECNGEVQDYHKFDYLLTYELDDMFGLEWIQNLPENNLSIISEF